MYAELILEIGKFSSVSTQVNVGVVDVFHGKYFKIDISNFRDAVVQLC